MRTFAEMTLWRTFEPEMIAPELTIDSCARPPSTNFAGGWAGKFADEVKTDRHGNVLAIRHPARTKANGKDAPRVMLAGHCDQIGLMVQHIDDAGFLYVQPIGGWDMQILLGQHLTVWTKQGGIPGVIARKAPHLMTNEERNKVPQFADVWIDIGAKDRKDAEDMVSAGRHGLKTGVGFYRFGPEQGADVAAYRDAAYAGLNRLRGELGDIALVEEQTR